MDRILEANRQRRTADDVSRLTLKLQHAPPVAHLHESSVQNYYYYNIRGLKHSLVGAKTLQKTEIQGTIGKGDPMHEVYIPHRIPRTWEQQR